MSNRRVEVGVDDPLPIVDRLRRVFVVLLIVYLPTSCGDTFPEPAREKADRTKGEE